MTTPRPRKHSPADQFLTDHQDRVVKSFLACVKQGNMIDAKTALQEAFKDSEALGGKQ